MIRRTVKIQLVVFGIITALGILYAGLGLIGIDALRPPYRVTAHFAGSGGIFTNAEVTYRGVTVGKVGKLTLTSDGVDVTLKIRRSHDVPADTLAVVANKSAVGEQYVDLQPRRSGAQYLRSGSVIPRADTRVPVDINTVVVDLDRLARSVDKHALEVLIGGLGDAFDGTGPVLRQLIEAGDQLTATLTEKLPETIRLIREGRIVLDTARATSSDLRRFAKGLADLSDSLKTADPDVRRLLDNGVAAAGELDQLLNPHQAALHVLLDDLATVNELQVARLDGLRQVLNTLPLLVARVPQPLFPDDHGILHNGQVSSHDPPPCVYTGTPRRLPHDDSPQQPTTDQHCGPGEGGGRTAGSVHDPSSSGEDSWVPYPPAPAAPAASGWTGGQQQLLGSQSWLSLLLAVIS